MVDKTVIAAKTAATLDAVQRIREVLPRDVARFERDRTIREVVVLNLFVALQECLALATHWVADEGWAVPGSSREVFESLAEHGVLSPELAQRLAAAAGFRNLVAHQYGVLDAARVHEIATSGLDDLVELCAILAQRARGD